MKTIILTVIMFMFTLFLFFLFTWVAPISATNPMTSSRKFHAVTVLPSGKVLLIENSR